MIPADDDLAHDKEYRRSLKDWETWVDAMTQKIIEVDETIPELPFKDVNFRIYRDIRFSNDPTPYKVPLSSGASLQIVKLLMHIALASLLRRMVSYRPKRSLCVLLHPHGAGKI